MQLISLPLGYLLHLIYLFALIYSNWINNNENSVLSIKNFIVFTAPAWSAFLGMCIMHWNFAQKENSTVAL
jgi:uncharacterized membrane protein